MQSEFIFTSESTTEGHPDKLCDQISDAIVGRYLHHDPASRVVAECAVTTGLVFLSIKYHGTATVNAADTARDVMRRVGYADPSFNPKTCTIMTSIHEYEEAEIGLDGASIEAADPDEVVARDQATIFGFACTHTPAFMPLPIWLAHKLSARLSAVRRSGDLDYLGPDGKTQVAVEFRERRPYRIHGITLLASQVHGGPPAPRLRDDLVEQVIEPVFAEEEIRPDTSTRVAVNPEGPFFLGGPAFHAGLTGRKTAVDTYGEFARHSGAALSGKDPTRIDRVGAYAARHAAKNVVAAGLADLCEVQLSYSIGVAQPVSVQVETWGSGRLPEDEIARRIKGTLDFRLGAIVRRFKMLELAPRDVEFYRKLACYGQVGRIDLDLPWERLDAVDSLRRP